MKSPGEYLRWLSLLGLVSHQIYFIVHGSALLKNKEGEMAGIFICDNSDHNEEMMTQCTGVDDFTTCGDGGADIQCIRSSCGRPLFPHIGVSYAGSSNPYNPNSATSTQSFITIVALFYSLIPYLLVIFYGIHFLALGNVVPLMRLVQIGFMELVNDAMLKNVVKQPRPTGSCLYFHSYGMPSGHAVNSVGLLTCILLELLLYHPNLFGQRNATAPESCEVYQQGEGESQIDYAYNFAWGIGWQKISNEAGNNDLDASAFSQDGDSVDEDVIMEMSNPLLSSSNSISISESFSYSIIPIQSWGYHFKSKWLHHQYALLWSILLLPVPLSRFYLHDHSPVQIAVGSLVGIILGSTWFFCVIRGWLFRFGSVTRESIMQYLVECRLGKLFGLNLGVSGGT